MHQILDIWSISTMIFTLFISLAVVLFELNMITRRQLTITGTIVYLIAILALWIAVCIIVINTKGEA